MQVGWLHINFLFLWKHFTTLLVYVHVRTAYGAVILNIRYAFCLFEDLHSQRDNGVPTMITRSIIHHLSKGVPKNEKDTFRSKYLCIVSITEMTANRGVNFSESHVRLGHSLGTYQERHLDQNIHTLTLPGAYAFNGWVDAVGIYCQLIPD